MYFVLIGLSCLLIARIVPIKFLLSNERDLSSERLHSVCQQRPRERDTHTETERQREKGVGRLSSHHCNASVAFKPSKLLARSTMPTGIERVDDMPTNTTKSMHANEILARKLDEDQRCANVMKLLTEPNSI
jgi:hypothetical protein